MKTKLFQLFIFIFVFSLQTNVQGQTFDLDIIELQHRPAEELIPLLKPFLVPEAAITARGYKLIIKSTPKNIAQIRKIIAEMDAALKQLQITVSIGRHSEQEQMKTQAEILAQIKNEGSQVEIATDDMPSSDTSGAIIRGEKKTDNSKISGQVRTKRTTTKRDRPIHQSIRSSEGQWATIRTGQAIPIVERTHNPDGTVTQTIRYHSATSGFKILPRLQPDNQVALYIRPYQTTPSPQNKGRFDIQNMETTVIGQVGEWIALGGMQELSTGKVDSRITSTRSRTERHDSVFVKIDIIQ